MFPLSPWQKGLEYFMKQASSIRTFMVGIFYGTENLSFSLIYTGQGSSDRCPWNKGCGTLPISSTPSVPNGEGKISSDFWKVILEKRLLISRKKKPSFKGFFPQWSTSKGVGGRAGPNA